MLLGIAAGILIGFAFEFPYSAEYSFYITMGLLAAMDSIVGAVRAHMEDKYDNLIFVTGFVTNAVLASVLTFVGDKLGVPLYYAAILVFGGRMFNNLAVARHIVVDNIRAKKSSRKQDEK